MGMPDGCQLMKVTRIAVDRLEMGIILLHHPQGIRHVHAVAKDMKHEYVFGMALADGKMELAGAYTFIIYNRVAFEYSSRSAVFADGHHRQGVLQTDRVTSAVGKLEASAHQIIDGTFDTRTGG